MSEQTTTNAASETFNQLLARAHDAVAGYELAAETTEHQQLSQFFENQAAQRRDFVNEIKEYLVDLGAKPDEEASLTGKIHQAFIKIKTTLVGQDDLALIEECRRGEETAMLDYKAALATPGLGEDGMQMLRDHGVELLKQLDLLQAIEAELKETLGS